MTLIPLPDRAVLTVTGEAARPFLHNLLTQDVETLSVGEARFAALLTPQGRLLHDMILIGREDGVWIDVANVAAADLLRRLTLYRLRAKVTLERTGISVAARLSSASEPGGLTVVDPRTPLLGRRVYGEPSASDDATDYDARRLALGIPDAVRDGLSDRVYPLEADYDLLNAIDFKKGCFVGQETTSRMHRRGTLKTRLLPLVFDGAAPPSGAEVLNGERRAGETLSGMDGRCLALLRLDRLDGALTVEGRPVRVDPPPWFPPLLATAADVPTV